MEAVVNIDNAIKLLQLSLHFTMRRIDDWQNVVPEGRALRNECETFQAIIVGVLDKPYLPISGILQDVNKTMQKTNDLIDKFVIEDTKEDRSMRSKAGWAFRRMLLARKHRHAFILTTKQLEFSKIKIHDTLTLSAIVNKPTVHWYHGDMVNPESFAFWKEICGEELYASDWSIFIETYQQRYNHDWDSTMLERIRRVACRNGHRLTVSGFVTLTKMCGFPLNFDHLPLLVDSHASISSPARMEVAHLVNTLISDYSTKEMRDMIVDIFKWYKGCDKKDRLAWQERANEWAREIKKNRAKNPDQLDDHGTLVEKVDMARRTYSFFFQRYMVVFKIGQLSKEVFAEVDFPGKARMYEFINYVKPLDDANYHIVMGANPDEWQSKQLKVYKFLDDYIKSDKKAKKEATKRAERAAQVVEALEQIGLDNSVSSLSVGTSNPFQDENGQLVL